MTMIRSTRSNGAVARRRRLQTSRWDAADHLKTPGSRLAYLEAALADGDPSLVAAALGDLARAMGMAEVARQTGFGRESLYKSLSENGNPELGTVLRVVEALGLQLEVIERKSG